MNEIATKFGLVFWGLFLVIFDVSINQFDLLPDFIGYVLVAAGLGGLTSLSGQFATAQTYAWVLVPLALLALSPLGGLGWVLGLVSLGLHCAMMWFLLGGIMDYATARHRPDLAEHASTRRMAYVSLICVVTFLGFAAQGLGVPAVTLTAIIAVCLVVLLVMILHLIYRVKTEVTP